MKELSLRAKSYLEVNLENLRYNFQSLNKLYPKHQTIFMVKANAYGHGVSKVIDFCIEQSLCRNFGLASVYESKEIENNDALLWIFSEVDFSGSIELYQRENLVPVISNLDDLTLWLDHYADRNFSLKFDTGMNRLGFKTDELENLITLLNRKKITKIFHVMSHYSSSYLPLDKKNNMTHDQKDHFKRILQKFSENDIEIDGSSLANSGAIEQGYVHKDSTHIRAGLLMYGASSSFNKSSKLKMKKLASLKSEIIKVCNLKEGTKVGYGAVKLKKDSYVAYIPLGYGDGLLTSFSGSKVECEGQEGEILARVNMDLCAIAFEKEVYDGQTVVVWGDNIEAFSRQVGHIPYEIYCLVSRRVPRKYLIA